MGTIFRSFFVVNWLRVHIVVLAALKQSFEVTPPRLAGLCIIRNMPKSFTRNANTQSRAGMEDFKTLLPAGHRSNNPLLRSHSWHLIQGSNGEI